MPCDSVRVRDISELSENPMRPLTQDEIDHFDEYMTFKNHDISAKDVSLTEAVKEVVANMNYYLGIPEGKNVY